jgi:hypothetical protein
MKKQYALLANSTKHGTVAMVENGFKMRWSKTQVRTWSYPPSHYWKKGYYIVRIGSKNCPIKVSANGTINESFTTRCTLG